MVSERRVRELVAEELRRLSGAGFEPNADYEIPGQDPDYETGSLRLPEDIEANEHDSDGSTQGPVPVGGTKFLDTTVYNKVDENQVYGVIVSVPGAHDGALLIRGPGPNGSVRQVSRTGPDAFNTPIGRFFSGTLHITGTYENGQDPGMVKITYGEAESQEDLGDFDTGAIETEEPEIITGTETISLPPGKYVVTVHGELEIPNGDTGGVTFHYITPSMGPADWRALPALPVVE